MFNRLLFAAFLACFLAVPKANAITWGEPDDGEHPNVGTLLFVQNGVGFFSCTGTMIAPRVMLTAGHCVAGADESGVMQPNDLTYVRFDEEGLAGIGDYPTLQAWFDAEWIATDMVIPHPMWSDYSEFPDTYDIGVVILSEDVFPANGFGEIPEEGFLDGLKGRDKNFFQSVGYGRQGTLKPFAMNDYERYKGDVRLLETTSYLSGKGGSSAKFSNNPGIGGGTCFVDSGGPTFFKETNLIVYVTSFGWAKNGNCVGNDFNYRTDIPPAQSFLDMVLGLYGD